MANMNELPLVSIVIPCFNSACFVTETIESVIAQTYTNWECILVDDHSADETLAIVSEYSARMPERFKICVNSGKGACSARNDGIEQSSGQYLKFLDSDDVLFDSHTLKTQVDFALASKRDIVYGVEHYYSVNFENGAFIKSRGEPLSPDNINTDYFYNRPITSNFLVNKQSLRDIKWDKNLKSGQEFNFLFTCFIAGLTFGYQDIPVVKIRAHNSPHRISEKTRKQYASEKLELIMSMCEIVRKHNYKNCDFTQAFNVWMMSESYLALRARNWKAFREIQRLLAPPRALKIPGARERYLYFVNSKLPLLSFSATEVLRRFFDYEIR